jgi:hypothetical protein
MVLKPIKQRNPTSQNEKQGLMTIGIIMTSTGLIVVNNYYFPFHMISEGYHVYFFLSRDSTLEIANQSCKCKILEKYICRW